MHTDLNDISAMTAHSYPFLTLPCLSAQPVIWQARLPLPLSVQEGGQEQIQPLNHIIHTQKRGETRLPVPTRNVGSLNSIRTKQPRRCLKIHPPDSVLLVWLCKLDQLDCKIKSSIETRQRRQDERHLIGR